MVARSSSTCTAGTVGRSERSGRISACSTTGIPARVTTSIPVTATTPVEVYAGVRYGHFSAKYSHALTHLFGMKTQTIGGYCGIGADGTAATTDCLGTGSSTGSGYMDLNAAFDVAARVNLALHYGHQYVRSYARLSYGDYRIALTRPFGAITLGAAVVSTDAESRFYRYTPTTAGSRETENVGRLAIVWSASKAF